MKKVVVKMKLKSREEFEKKLDEMGMEFAPIYWQHDRVFVPRNYRRGGGFPRLIMRTEMKAVDRPAKYYMILKRHIEDSNSEVMDETTVKDYTEAANIILQLGFKQVAEISRRRQEIKMEEGTVMYLDKVEGLSGYYVKIEVEVESKDSIEVLRNEILRTFESLDQNNIVLQTYSELIGAA
jgi:predicted adenylyl cyclase CyaB